MAEHYKRHAVQTCEGHLGEGQDDGGEVGLHQGGEGGPEGWQAVQEQHSCLANTS